MSRAIPLLACLALLAAAPAHGGRRSGSAGVTVALPAGWHDWRIPTNLQPAVTDPLTRVVAVSAPFRFAGTGCQVADYAFPSTAVAIVVVEWIRLWHNGTWTKRPRAFTAKSLPLRPPPAIECFDGPGGSAQFVDHGRHFGVYLLAGRRASGASIARARAVLNSLRVR